MKKRKKQKKSRSINKSIAAWVMALAFATAGILAGYALRHRFPAFDPLPLFGILAAAFAVACMFNRLSATAFARKHFGMPAEEMSQLIVTHDEACRKDPHAVIRQFAGMSAFPLFLLGLYFLLSLSLVVTGEMCARVDGDGVWHSIVASCGTLGGCYLLYMPLYRILEELPPRPKKENWIPCEKLPVISQMARRAAETAGVRGKIRFEVIRDCDCYVNRYGKTYVVCLGTRLMAVLTPEEMEQALLMSFSAYSHPRLNRQIQFRYRLGMLGDAKVRPASPVFDLFFSYADASLEWEYELYSRAVKRALSMESYRLVRERGDLQSAMGVLSKEAFWSYYVFEYPHFMPHSFYESPTPPTHFEQDVCLAFRRACTERSDAWSLMLGKEMEGTVPSDIPFRAERRSLDPEGRVTVSVGLPELSSPYGEEALRLIRENEETLYRHPSAAAEYERARRREYLAPLETVEAYEADPTGYTTPDLSPVINGYRDIGQFDRAEAICDGILAREHNQFAMAHALYFKGMCMLHRYETEGIDLIYRAIDLNKNYMKDGFEMVGEYCILRGLSDEYAAFRHRAEIQMDAHAYNQEGASYLSAFDRLEPEEGLGDMLPDILAYMERVANGGIREIYLVRKVISEDFFTSVFVINFEYGADEAQMGRIYESIFNYLDAYPVDWQFSLFVYDRETERAVKRVERSLVWTKKE